jgi:hypothetical protein
MIHSSQTLPKRKRVPNKLIAGFAAFAATAVITASGFAAAATGNKPTKLQCQQAGFTNYGQCVKQWAQSHNPHHNPGNGYGNNGNNNVAVDNTIEVNLENSNNNVIHVINNIIVNIFN